MTVGERVELDIVELAAGGDGLGFIGGRACFAPLAAPGDRVAARIVAIKEGYFRAEIESILRPGSGRVVAFCPFYGECGGCSLMHLGYAEQLEAKRRIVAEAFRRVGGYAEGVQIEAAASAPRAYRNRAQFHVAEGGLGYAARSSRRVVAVDSCPILVPPLERLVAERGAGASYPAGVDLGAGRRFNAFSPRLPAALAGEAPAGYGEDAPAYLEGRDAEARAWVAGKEFAFHVGGFFQSNLGLLPELVRDACHGVAGGRAADLYAGVGLFGAFLAERFERVVCVEQDARALGYASRNVGGRADFFAGGMEAWTAGPQAKRPYEYALVDPPRSGLAPSVRRWLSESKPPLIGYVSCDPVALARDAGALRGAGYELVRLKIYDFYPQTAHVESYARFALR